jgi:hypothetical protein
MRLRYKSALRYLCVARRDSHALFACLHLDGASIEAVVVAAFFEAIRPAELDLLEDGLMALDAERAQRAQHQADQITRAAHEARLAERQYRAVMPRYKHLFPHLPGAPTSTSRGHAPLPAP